MGKCSRLSLHPPCPVILTPGAVFRGQLGVLSAFFSEVPPVGHATDHAEEQYSVLQATSLRQSGTPKALAMRFKVSMRSFSSPRSMFE